MATWRYEISLLVLKKYFTHSLCSLVKYFSTLEEKFRISARPCNILYLYHVHHHLHHLHDKISIDEIRTILTSATGFIFVIIIIDITIIGIVYLLKDKLFPSSSSSSSSIYI